MSDRTPLPCALPWMVTLRCFVCGLKKRVERDDTDPPGTELVETQCPECVGSDYSMTSYYDADGREIFQVPPAQPAPPAAHAKEE